MDFNRNKQGRFCCGIERSVFPLLKVKGTIQGKDINITIYPKNNYINVHLANQLLILEPSIFEQSYFFNPKGHAINNLQLIIIFSYPNSMR